MLLLWRGLLAASAVMLSLLLISLPFIDDPATWAIATVSLAMLGVVGVGSAILLHYRWEPFD